MEFSENEESIAAIRRLYHVTLWSATDSHIAQPQAAVDPFLLVRGGTSSTKQLVVHLRVFHLLLVHQTAVCYPKVKL